MPPRPWMSLPQLTMLAAIAVLSGWAGGLIATAQELSPLEDGPAEASPVFPASTLRDLLPAPRTGAMSPAGALGAPKPATQPRGQGVPGCLVTHDGRVFQGRILEQGEEAYRVDSVGGTAVLPHGEVLTIGDSLADAYTRIRGNMPRPGAEGHLDLGRWCLQNELYQEASEEAQAALKLEPRRQAALELLSQADQALTAVRHPLPAPTVATSELPPQAEFVRRIQPLLQNKCGNANCHGSSSASQFKLQTVATGSRPQNLRTLQNLEAVFKRIDRDHPDQSPLLVESQQLTGPHANVFVGQRAQEHRDRLVAWVRQISRQGVAQPAPAQENLPRPLMTFRPHAASEDVAEPTILPASAEEFAPPVTPLRAAPPQIASPSPPRPKLAPLRSPEVMRLLETQAPDPFDPAEFNRLVHGN